MPLLIALWINQCMTVAGLDLNLKILKSDGSCPGAVQVINWLKGVFDALDKKYVCVTLLSLCVNTFLKAANIRSLAYSEFCSKCMANVPEDA